MNLYELELNGEKLSIPAQKIGDELWYHYKGQTHVYKPDGIGVKKAKSGASSKHTGDVHAPMPGKITRIKCIVEDAVTVHQVLIVMEAMKMEYSLKSSVVGTVKGVLCKEGDQVKLGQLLVNIERSPT